MNTLTDFYTSLDSLFQSAKTRTEAFAAANRAAEHLGFPHVIHAPVRNHPNAAQNWAATSYPDDWQRLYAEKRYLERNPIRRHTLITSQPFRWSTLEQNLPIAQRELFHDCRSTGMAEGIVVPVHGPWGQAIAIGFACQDADAADERSVPLLQLIALRLHHLFDQPPPESIRLTQREREILLRVAEGHENGSISRLLTIAESSVEWHLKNIYAKLEVRNRTAAVVKAIQTGLLQVCPPGYPRLSTKAQGSSIQASDQRSARCPAKQQTCVTFSIACSALPALRRPSHTCIAP